MNMCVCVCVCVCVNPWPHLVADELLQKCDQLGRLVLVGLGQVDVLEVEHQALRAVRPKDLARLRKQRRCFRVCLRASRLASEAPRVNPTRLLVRKGRCMCVTNPGLTRYIYI